MISFHYETPFELPNEAQIEDWIGKVIASENKREGDINYIFCDDEYLHKLNVEFLNHDTLTDIISFDNSVGNELHGDIFISVERVADNAKDFNVSCCWTFKITYSLLFFPFCCACHRMFMR